MKKLLSTNFSKPYVTPFVFLVTLALCSLSMNSYAVTANTGYSATPVTANHVTDYEQLRAIAATALAEVAKIRDQVRHDRYDQVHENLSQLYTLIALMKAGRPTGEIDALLQYYNEHLAFEDNKQVLADIKPLYCALDELPQTEQTSLARKQLDNLRAALQDNKRKDALKALENMQRTLAKDDVDFSLQAAEENLQDVTRLYNQQQPLAKAPALLELEANMLQIIGAL